MSYYSIVCVCVFVGVCVCLCVGVYTNVIHKPMSESLLLALHLFCRFFFFLYIPHDIHLQLLVSMCECECIYQKPHNKVILLYVTKKTAGVCVSRESQLVMMMVKKSLFFFSLFSFWWTTRKHDFTFCVCLPQTSPMFFQHKHRHTHIHTPPLHSTLSSSFVLLFAFSYFCVSHCRAKYRKQNKTENKKQKIKKRKLIQPLTVNFSNCVFFVDIDMVTENEKK